ncbi:NAD(P)-dependent alcohol dehydrogenase [Microbacterium flavescens]|uniref:NAD(P)-dependent alcohol dehydrogenase n=1 Tax=Microbacterium flavescens TaxID=69366 RepID=UPI001BDF18D4|nr:NAD(P)-dependent alcohol dehydrogenase [Microbacterium flavescens]BFF10077.1 NAD(P)-dependent alcohol dehydrogenase [Microbacterium flavescens]
MKAIVQRAYGEPSVLGLEDVERPGIGAGEVLVRVRASSINHADWVYISGRPSISRLAFGLKAPKSPVRGKDVAGVVEATGPGVTAFAVGDEVYGEFDGGAFAEYVAAPVAMIARKPANLTFEQAGTVPLAGMTAYLGLRDAGAVTTGQRVLINGASGGVGTFAVQIAKALGAEVTAVASSRNATLVRQLGADHAIDYVRDDFTRGTTRYDVILDLIGNHPLARLRSVLTPKGKLVLSSGTGHPVFGPMGRLLRAVAISPFVGQTLSLFSQHGSSQALDELRELAEAGLITPAIDRTFPLADVPAAVRYFVEQHARGKIAILL